jgi:hemoglobin
VSRYNNDGRTMAQELIENRSAWELLGGTDGGAPEAFAALVDAFYDGVAEDALLRPMYPSESDLKEERENLALFLIQYFGGPALYAVKRGHPRLRMRHQSFKIGPAARDAWLYHMEAAIVATPSVAQVAPQLRAYFIDVAHFLQNSDTD